MELVPRRCEHRSVCRGRRSRPLAPATIRLRHDQIHAALTALVDSGLTRESITALADLVTVPNFKKIAQRRLDMADRNTNSFNRSLVNTLVQMAKEWVKTDAATLTELKRLAGKIPAPRGDLTQKNKRFLRQFDDPVVLQRLKACPPSCGRRCAATKSPISAPCLGPSGVGLEILIHMPIRMQNLARLEFDVHLFLRDGPGAVSTLDIPADEVKNKRPIEFDIPPHIARMLIEYRDHIVPKIIRRRPNRLFVNRTEPRSTRKPCRS